MIISVYTFSIIIFIYFYCCKLFSLLIHSYSKILTLINVKRVPKLFFGFVTIESGTKRREAMYDIWIHKILKYGHDYVYCTQNQIEPKFKWTPLKNWTTHYPKTPNGMFIANRDRENKRITMCDYFLHTDADFFINPTDDVFVDAERINELAKILGSKYDTEKDLIILGNCMFNILHGGSGYIFTRAMARKFMHFSERWLRESGGPDDLEMNKFLRYMNLTIVNGSSPYMSGRSFSGLDTRVVNTSNFKMCNTSWYDERCHQKVFKLEDVYLMHPTGYNIGHNILIWNNFLQLIYNSSHHYGWYSTASSGHEICRFD